MPVTGSSVGSGGPVSEHKIYSPACWLEDTSDEQPMTKGLGMYFQPFEGSCTNPLGFIKFTSEYVPLFDNHCLQHNLHFFTVFCNHLTLSIMPKWQLHIDHWRTFQLQNIHYIASNLLQLIKIALVRLNSTEGVKGNQSNRLPVPGGLFRQDCPACRYIYGGFNIVSWKR